MKKTSIISLVLIMLFVSCVNDANIITSTTKESPTIINSKFNNSLKNDLNLFAINHIKISIEISNLIKQNNKVDFSKISFESLNT